MVWNCYIWMVEGSCWKVVGSREVKGVILFVLREIFVSIFGVILVVWVIFCEGIYNFDF